MKYSRKSGLLKPSRRLAILAALSGVVGASLGFLLLYFGAYNVSALEQHTPPVYNFLQLAMIRSAGIRSRKIEQPDPRQFDRLAGLVLYEQHCQQCHGAPGVGPESFSLGMMPAPTAIVSIARKRSPREIFWLIENGIKMTGMPAWRYRLSNRQIWQVVGFIEEIPTLTVAEYLILRRQARERGIETDTEAFVPEEEISTLEYGRVALQQYNCASCHEIPGLTSAHNHVGPPLGGIAERSFIAGVLANTDENLVRWIRFPRQIDPDSAMPNLGVTERHARQMVVYLKTAGLKSRGMKTTGLKPPVD
jgi:mono/diheme cytochrome c family protein/cytochrome c2